MKKIDFMSTPMAMNNGCTPAKGGKKATKPASKPQTKRGTKRGK